MICHKGKVIDWISIEEQKYVPRLASVHLWPSPPIYGHSHCVIFNSIHRWLKIPYILEWAGPCLFPEDSFKEIEQHVHFILGTYKPNKETISKEASHYRSTQDYTIPYLTRMKKEPKKHGIYHIYISLKKEGSGDIFKRIIIISQKTKMLTHSHLVDISISSLSVYWEWWVLMWWLRMPKT